MSLEDPRADFIAFAESLPALPTSVLATATAPKDDDRPVSHEDYKRLEQPTMYALQINFDFDAEPFWDRLYSLGVDKVPGELVPIVKDYWEHSLPMTKGRLAKVTHWLRGLPSWQGTDDHTRPATAMVKGVCVECETCRGTGVRGYSCPCRRHSEDCDPDKCRQCSGCGYFVV
jgi:hypothetical protein